MFIRLMRMNSVVLMVTKDRVGRGAVPMLLHRSRQKSYHCSRFFQ